MQIFYDEIFIFMHFSILFYIFRLDEEMHFPLFYHSSILSIKKSINFIKFIDFFKNRFSVLSNNYYSKKIKKIELYH